MSRLISDVFEALKIREYKIKGVIKNESDFNSMFSKTDGKEKDITWSQVQTALKEGGVVAINQVRKQRNELLKETDWMSSSDYTITSEWKTYRQALRDLPANSSKATWDGEKLSNITYPTKPTD